MTQTDTSQNARTAGAPGVPGAARPGAAENKRNIETAYALSPMQQGMLFHSLYAPESGVYHEQLTCTLVGELNVTAFERAWQSVIQRHPILRSAFAWRRLEKPIQAVYKEVTLAIDSRDLRGLSPAEQDQALATYLATDRARGFDLARPPLMRLALLRVGDGAGGPEHRLVWSHHHILMDGWSLPLLLKEVFTFYEAFANNRPASLGLPRPYKDYITWLQGQDLAAAEVYWRKQLAGRRAATSIPTVRTQPQGTGTGEHELRLSEELTESLNRLARQNGVTLSTLVQGVWAILLSRYSGDDDVVFGVTVSGRPPTLPGADTMVGVFINTLPVRVQVDERMAFGSWLRSLQVQLAELRQFEYTPLVQVQGWTEVPREEPLFDSIVVFENYPVDTALREKLSSLEIRDVRSFEQTNYGLTFVSGPGRELVLKISYDRARYDEAAVWRMLGHLAQILSGAARDLGLNAPIQSLPLLTPEEQVQLAAWNATAAPLPDRPIHAFFEDWAARTPDAPAAVFVAGAHPPVAYTYAELNARANRLAHYLIAHGAGRANGVGGETLVGISVTRSLDQVVALLATLKAGAAYLPLDPNYPPDRRHFMLADAGVTLVLTHAHLLDPEPLASEPLAAESPSATHFCLDRDWDQLAGYPDTTPALTLSGEHLAYVIYTSGSTGRPKGVLVAHRGLTNLVRAQTAAFGITPADRILQFASFSFDAAVSETFMALAAGATLYLAPQTTLAAPPELTRLLQDYAISAVTLPPSLLALLDPAGLDDLQCLISAGERLPAAVAARWAPGRRLFNAYGPTEATIGPTLGRVADLPAGAASAPVGRPIANIAIHLRDRYGNPVPVGVPGELCVAGAGLARGYLGRPDLTAERFVPLATHAHECDEFGQPRATRLYRTGDLARYLPDGQLEILGRIDQQVKLRGFRIELGEIEAVLRELPGVADAVALVQAETPGDPAARLVAYLVAGDSTSEAAGDWRAHLRARLPEYMLPAAFVLLDAFPLTPNGKVDRAALLAREPEAGGLGFAAGRRARVAPRTPDEELVAGVFEQVLGVQNVSIDDSFFDLGGHSLLATRLASRIREVFGVELALRDLFDARTVAAIAEKVAAARRSDSTEPAPPITRTPRPGAPDAPEGLRLPLSYAQQRLWFLDQLEQGSIFYNIPTVIRLRGPLDVAALNAALDDIIARHEVLRTTFAASGGVPCQVIAPSLSIPLPLTDLTELAATERESRARELAREEIRGRFDLAAGPLLRARLFKLGDEEHIAVLTIHHIVADGWSMGVLIAELANLYEGRLGKPGFSPAVLPDLPIQYADYAAWQRGWLETEDRGEGSSPLQSQLEYWKRQLAGVPALLDLPTDRPRPAIQSSNGATHTFRFSAELSDGLLTLSRKEGVTLFMTLLAGYQALLSRYSGQTDIVVGSALANRQRAEVEPLIGFFVNTLVFRTLFEPGPAGPLTFKDLLARVRATALSAYSHQDVPFEMLVDAVQPERNLSHPPLFQAAFSLQNVPMPVRELPGLLLEPVNLDKGIAGYDMLLQVTETAGGLACAWEYNTDLFDGATIERMAVHLQNLFGAAVADPTRPVATLPLLTERERETMLVEWNATAVPFPADRTIHSLFEDQARRIPDAPAAIFALPGAPAQALTLSYAELDQRANQLAHHLVALGLRPNTLAGICTERSLDMVVGILGILKAGAAYLPLDPNYPADRLAFMLADAGTGGGLDIVLTQSHLVERLPLRGEAGAITHLVRLDADWDAIGTQPDTSPRVRVTADDLAYCIYTSGSTGRPKGTLLRHRGLCNLADVHHREFDMGEGKRVLQFSPFSFDASVWETVMALRNGAALVLTGQDVLASGPDLLRLLQEQRVTTVTLPPSLLAVLSPAAVQTGALPDLQTVIAAGERCTNEIVQAWAPGRNFFNAYGPTETTVCASIHRTDWTADWPFGGPPIGRPISNFQLYVVDENLEPQPIGVPGELLIGGVGLAQGYLNRPELTAERFIRKPGLSGGDRLYRTGDLVRWLPDGNLEFLGRIDDQVKVRGFRIELGEVEAVLREHPAVQDAVVTARGDMLVGYVITTGAGTETPPADLRAMLRTHLRARLPEYMVPAAFVVVEAFPLSPAGKVDRRRLPAPDETRRDGTAEYVAPRTETESKLAAMAAELLRLERVGVEDNFFELGGHSLLATQLISRIREQFKVEVALKALFEHPTVAGLADAVDAGLKKQAVEAAKVADTLAKIKGMTPEQVKALLAEKRMKPAQSGTTSGGKDRPE